MGHEVVSTWLDEVAKPESMTQDQFYKKLAMKDIAELTSADMVIVDIGDKSTSGGRDTELGLALGSFAKKQVYLVGTPFSVFHQLVDRIYYTWDDLLAEFPDGKALPTA
jgi:nucleoside 2-deoxyribosyltransferase